MNFIDAKAICREGEMAKEGRQSREHHVEKEVDRNTATACLEDISDVKRRHYRRCNSIAGAVRSIRFLTVTVSSVMLGHLLFCSAAHSKLAQDPYRSFVSSPLCSLSSFLGAFVKRDAAQSVVQFRKIDKGVGEFGEG